MPSRLRSLSILTVVLVSGCATAGAPRSSPSPSPVPVTKTTTDRDIRVTLTLEGPPIAAARSFISATVENVGSRTIRWAGGGCNDPVSVFIELSPGLDPGRTWPGLLGRFKTLALGDQFGRLTSVGYEAAARLPLPGQIPMYCTADFRWNQLEAGGRGSLRAAWEGTISDGLPASPGPATVTAYFQYIGVQGVVPDDRMEADPVSVAIDTQVQPPPGGVASGVAAAPVPLVPALAIDAALADPEFAAWVKAAPESTWINPEVSLIDGAWHVGLFRFGANQLERYGGVTLAPDGSVTGRRFEP